MPRTKLAAKLEAQQQLDKLIRMYLFMNHTNVYKCASQMGICPKTLYARIKYPSKFTLSELSTIRHILGIPQGEIVEAIEPHLE